MKLKTFELSNHDCSHTTLFISEASSFPNNIPVSFRVCGKKSCGIQFSNPSQVFGSECMSVFDSCGFLIFKPPRGCDYLHQGAPKFPSNLLCKSSFFSVKCSNPSGCGIPYPRAIGGFWSRAAAKLPNPRGNEVMGLEVSESKLGQVSESGRLWSFQIRGPGSFRIRARRSFQIRAVTKFPNPRAWVFPKQSSCKLSNLPLKFPNPGGPRISESMGPQVSESDVEVSESEVGPLPGVLKLPPTCHPVVSQLSYRCGLHLSSNCLSATCLPVLSQLSPRCLPDVVSQMLSPSSPRLLHLLSSCPVVFHLSPRCGLPDVVSQMWFPRCGLPLASQMWFPRCCLPVASKVSTLAV